MLRFSSTNIPKSTSIGQFCIDSSSNLYLCLGLPWPVSRPCTCPLSPGTTSLVCQCPFSPCWLNYSFWCHLQTCCTQTSCPCHQQRCLIALIFIQVPEEHHSKLASTWTVSHWSQSFEYEHPANSLSKVRSVINQIHIFSLETRVLYRTLSSNLYKP